MRAFLLLSTVFIIALGAGAQTSKVEGKISDEKSGNPIAGVSISLNGGKIIAVSTVDGNFIFITNAAKQNTITLSSIGYITKEISGVEVAYNEVTHLDIVLTPFSKTETALIIRSSVRRETVAALIAYQKNATVVAQVISAEAIRRSPDRNTGEVLKRVSGTSLQDGKYLVVRGLADRYNQAMLNGILLNSTEPDRKTFSFDIIPSSMIDNIVINKSFIPELSGEWAGALIQINIKDIPSKNYLQAQIGTGFNTQTLGQDFYNYEGSNTDFLGFDNGKRALPTTIPLKTAFANLSAQQKSAYGPAFENVWNSRKGNSNFTPALNQCFLINGGFNKNLGGNNKLATTLAFNYTRNIRRTSSQNQVNSFQNNIPSTKYDYFNNKYSKDILAGALANITLQLGNNSKLSFKNILNVNTANYTTLRTGKDYESSANGDNIIASELAFKANTFFNNQLSGEHNIKQYETKLHWFGSFNILDQYIPDQRRLQYNQLNGDTMEPFLAAIGGSNASQKSGSRYFGYLSDYVYTAGADIRRDFKINKATQSIKAGYFFQVKDRLFDSRPFAIYLPQENKALRLLGPDKIFAGENFGDGSNNKFALNELGGDRYRYLANAILNAGFLQFDNQFLNKFRAVWGLRVEDFDQVIGSVNKKDPRHVYSKKTDFLPGINLTYKVDAKTNIRLSGSQTVIRPEFRELSTFQFYDFDLGATIAGNTSLQRTRVTNIDFRYELYPAAGELFTLGVFYKYFKNPIESIFNAPDSYNFVNADEANSFGAELEFRKKLAFIPSLKNFILQGNVSYIYNRVSGIGEDLARSMQGQSPYLLNASLQYDLEKYGINTTLLFNQIGRRIAFVGGSETPPIWENPRPILDFQIAKKIIKDKGEIKLNVVDIFNKPAIFYNNLNNNKRYDKGIDAFAITRQYGTSVSISFGYNF